MSQRARVSVCVEQINGVVIYVTWTGRTIRAIHKAAKSAYPGARVSFGRGVYEQCFGAH